MPKSFGPVSRMTGVGPICRQDEWQGAASLTAAIPGAAMINTATAPLPPNLWALEESHGMDNSSER